MASTTPAPPPKITKLNLRALHVMWRITRYLGLTPNIDHTDFKLQSPLYVFSIINITFNVVLYLLITYMRYAVFAATMVPSVYFCFALSDLLLLLHNITIIVVAEKCRREILRIWLRFEKVDLMLKQVHLDEKCHLRRYKIEFFGAQVIFITYITLNFYKWMDYMGYKVAILNAMKDMMYYYILVTAELLRNYVMFVRYRIAALKFVMKNFAVSNPDYYMFVLESQCSLPVKKLDWSVDRINEVFTLIYGIVEDYNKIYGVIFVMYIVNCVVNIIVPINLAMVYGSGQRQVIAGVHFDYELIILSMIWLSFPLVLGFGMLSACQQTEDEIQEMPKMCYILARQVDEKTKRELMEFANQINTLTPKFEASGFFTLNYGIVAPIFTAIISYIIVLIQFNALA